MIIAIGSDHGGFEYKNAAKDYLISKGYKVLDVGTDTKESCHYPIYAAEVAKLVSNKEAEFGILFCTTGEGVCIAANKIKGVRCGIGFNDDVSRLMREHNHANVIAFGQSFASFEDVIRRIEIFLKAVPQGDRHKIRVEMINALEK